VAVEPPDYVLVSRSSLQFRRSGDGSYSEARDYLRIHPDPDLQIVWRTKEVL
jgi:hypothetical protein